MAIMLPREQNKMSCIWLRSELAALPFSKINLTTFWPDLCPASFWQCAEYAFDFLLNLRLRPASAKADSVARSV